MKTRKKDFIIIAAILCLAVIAFGFNYLFFGNQGEVFGEIYVEGELVKTVELTKNQKFSVNERPQIVFEVKDHAIAFTQSDCPDEVCIHAGYLSHNGQSAACLPNKTSIRIRSKNADADDPDIVAYLDRFSVIGGVYE